MRSLGVDGMSFGKFLLEMLGLDLLRAIKAK
jgi:hypothetical protein